MKKIDLIIIDENQRYLEKLSNYLLSHKKYLFTIKSFSYVPDENQINVFKNKRAILLVDEESIHKQPKLKTCSPHILTHTRKTKGIYKFDSGKNIIAQILKEEPTLKVSFRKHSKQGKCQKISIFSPIGGAGTTTISYTFAKILSEKGHKVLHLSLDNIDRYYEMKHQENNLSHYFYYYLTNPDSLTSEVDLYIENKEKHYYIAPFKSLLDYEEISEEDFNGFIDKLLKHLDIEYLVLDLPWDRHQKTIGILSKSDYRFLITLDHQNAFDKVKAFKNDLKHLKYENIFEKESSVLIVNQVLKEETLWPWLELNENQVILPYLKSLNTERNFNASTFSDEYHFILSDLLEGLRSGDIDE